jgi:hypothetical protein
LSSEAGLFRKILWTFVLVISWIISGLLLIQNIEAFIEARFHVFSKDFILADESHIVGNDKFEVTHFAFDLNKPFRANNHISVKSRWRSQGACFIGLPNLARAT